MSKLHGLAVKKGITAKDVDKEQLKAGIKVEMEHTDDPKVAKTIALDHLVEYNKYYSYLKEMENKAKHLEHKQIKTQTRK